jgi:hypothetical protein
VVHTHVFFPGRVIQEGAARSSAVCCLGAMVKSLVENGMEAEF